MDLSALFSKVVILFVIMAVAYFIRKIGLVSKQCGKDLSALVINVTNPALVVAAALTSSRQLSNLQVGQLTLIAFAGYAVTISLSFLIPKLFRIERADFGIYRFMFIFSNVGFIGIPISTALLGPDAAFYVTIFMLPFQLLAFTYGIALISPDPAVRRFSPKIFLRPMIISSLLSYSIYLFNLRLPAIVGDALSMLGNTTSTLAMLVVGLSLAEVTLRSVFRDIRMYALSLIKLVVLPLAAAAILRPILHNEMMLGVTIVVLSLPIATNSTMLSAQYHGNIETASRGVALSTLLSVGTIPLVLYLVFR